MLNGKTLVSIEKSDTGATLTTWLYCNMWQLYAARNLGYEGYIYWPFRWNRSLTALQDPAKFAELPNMYDWYFKQPCGWTDKNPPPCEAAWEWETGPETGRFNLMGQPLETIKAFYRENLVFSDAVEARGQALAQKYGIDFSRTIGLSWRGTDCVTDGRPRMAIEVYFPWIDDILAADPGLRIMATAEEEGILAPLLARYPSAFVVAELAAAPIGCMQNPEKVRQDVPGYERGMVPALMVWLFSKCAHYVKNRSSTGAVASWLSTGNIICLGHAETLSYELIPDQVEHKGKRYPLNR